MNVRLATPADAATLADVAAATFPLACPPTASPESIADFISKNLTLTSFEGYLEDPGRVLFLAIEDGAAIGYAMLVVAEPTDPDVAASITLRPTSELSKLYVRPGHHGAGISVALVAAATDSARAAGCTGMWLGVNEENARANRFYEKSGFVRVGTKTFQLGETHESDFVRERPL
jgi:ribosomal protein S18 acetylase RimI-like enzyme